MGMAVDTCARCGRKDHTSDENVCAECYRQEERVMRRDVGDKTGPGWERRAMHLGIAIARAAKEHGTPNRFSFAELAELYGGPPPMLGGRVARDKLYQATVADSACGEHGDKLRIEIDRAGMVCVDVEPTVPDEVFVTMSDEGVPRDAFRSRAEAERQMAGMTGGTRYSRVERYVRAKEST